MLEPPPLDYAKPDTPGVAPVYRLRSQDVGAGCRYTLPAEPEAVRRLSRLVSFLSGLAFVTGIVLLFLPQSMNINVMPALTSAWASSIVLALAAAHWRHIADEPVVLEVQPEWIELASPTHLWGRRKRLDVRRVRSIRVLSRGGDLLTGKPLGNLYAYTRIHSHPLFYGLEMTELEEVAENIHAITGIARVKEFSLRSALKQAGE